MRELAEENGCLVDFSKGLRANPKTLIPVAVIDFRISEDDGYSFEMRVYVYLTDDFSGEYIDTVEIKDHQWFPKNPAPLDQMLPDNKFFFPNILQGELLVGGLHTLNGKVIENTLEAVSQKELLDLFKSI